MGSPNAHPLIRSVSSDKYPVLTVEQYIKWYNLWVVHPGGEVTAVDFPYDLDLPDNECVVGDHCVNPRAFVLLANANEWYVDPVALEVVIGRWEMDYKGASEYHVCEEMKRL